MKLRDLSDCLSCYKEGGLARVGDCRLPRIKSTNRNSLTKNMYNRSPGAEVPLNSMTRGLRTHQSRSQQHWFSMSSPTSSGEYPPTKRRRMSSATYSGGDPNTNMMNSDMNGHQNAMATNGNGQLINSNPVVTMQQSSIPKRGARACTACRKGKNRCEGEVCSTTCPFG